MRNIKATIVFTWVNFSIEFLVSHQIKAKGVKAL